MCIRDSLELIDQVEDFHALITDPPYSSGGAFRSDRSRSSTEKYVGGGKTKDGGQVQALVNIEIIGDNRDARSWTFWSTLWLSHVWQRLPNGAPVLTFTDWRQLPATTDCLQAAGFVWRGICPWTKPSHRPHCGRFAAAAEYFVWGTKGPMGIDFTKPPLPGAFIYSPPLRSKRLHQTEKPLQLMADLMPICPPGCTVFDPFMGVATTGVAALQSGRKFVGIEMHPEYFRLACQRIEEFHRQKDKG